MHARLLIVVLAAVALALLTAGSALAQTFPDVPPQHPYYEAIEGLAERGIINGYPNGDFGDPMYISRQQFTKMLVLTMGYAPTENDTCPFPDVEHTGGLYPFHYIAVAASTGLATGFADGTFRPASRITLEQVITMVVRAAGTRLQTPPLGWYGHFSSYKDLTHGENIRKAEYNGLLFHVRISSYFTSYATRAECAQILWTLLNPEVPRPLATVTSVVDGDTIHVDLDGTDTTVRLMGIDAPEAGEPFAAEAKAALASLVEGKKVLLEGDLAATDEHGQSLAYVYAWGSYHWAMVNPQILQLGLAKLSTVLPPNATYIGTFQDAQRWAQGKFAGIWVRICPLDIVSRNYDAPGDDNFNLNEEYITFRVLLSGTLAGYAMENGSQERYEFPDRVFSEGQVFKLHTGRGTDTQTDLYWGMTSEMWSNDGRGLILLLDPLGRPIGGMSVD